MLHTGHKSGNRCWSATLAFVSLCAMAIFSGCQVGTTSAGGGGGNPPPAPSATISLCDNGVANCPAATSFSVNTARDVVIQVAWENVPAGTHVQNLEISMPGGGLFQSSQTAFLIDGTGPGSASTSRLLPVAGTWIQQRHITGQWSMQVSLDGQPITSQIVEMNP
jgi:hypothetical protein